MRSAGKAARSLLLSTLAALCLAAPAQGAVGLKELEVILRGPHGEPLTQAGAHPDITTFFEVNTKPDPAGGPEEIPDEEIKDLEIDLPAGFVANPTAVPRCDSAGFLDSVTTGKPDCPDAAALGSTRIRFGNIPIAGSLPLYNLQPAPGKLFKFGFVVANVPVTVDAALRPAPPYNGFATSTNISQQSYFYSARTTLWGSPSEERHDPERGDCANQPPGVEETCPANLPDEALITLPRSCGPFQSFFKLRSWQNPSAWVTHSILTEPGTTGCAKLGFAPSITAQPTSDHAESPSGLNLAIEIPNIGIRSPDGLSNADIKKVVLALPEGVTANPSVAEGLAVCTSAQYEQEQLATAPGQGCPQEAKIGTVEAESQLLEGTIFRGNVYIAAQADNPFGSLLALYIIIRDPATGVFVKVAGKVEPEPGTGRLITTFDDLPQVPLSEARFRLREGGRSPLITPPACGPYTVEARFTPWSDPSRELAQTDSFQITRGVGGTDCPPAGPPPFDPGFAAGTTNNDAGRYSPFFMRLTRRDADQDLTRFSATLPPGVVGKLAGLAKCSEAQIADAKRSGGREELASPSCPPSSEVGDTLAGAGVGSQLTYVKGKLYLAGPFAGDPLSVVAITPAVAGPFDVGTVVVREALTLDPITGQVKADGANSDPIPHILAGIPLKVRDLRVFVDRPEFTLNPTDCARFETVATIFGGGTLLAPQDDAPVTRSARFRAANCAKLGFKPSLKLRLKGGTRRGDNPALRALYRPRPGDANLEDTVVRLPRSAFLDQDHIRTICTRVQFAADNCPKGAVYGTVAAFTPLLAEPLRGPVYLRSSSNELPDLVFDLRGIVDIEASARLDSIRGGIRATFTDVPDAPLSKVVLRMQGGEKGLIVNSRNLCSGRKPRASAALAAHNGRERDLRPVMRVGCGERG